MNNSSINAAVRTKPQQKQQQPLFALATGDTELFPQQAQQQSWPKPQHRQTHHLKQQQQDYLQVAARQNHHSTAHHHKHHHRSQSQELSKEQGQPERRQGANQEHQQSLSDATTTPSSSSSYDHASSPRVVFGPGTISRLPTELGRLRVTSPLIVSSPSRVSLSKKVQALIPNLNSRILDSAVLSVPARVIDDAVSRISGRDCVISVGGGSAVSLARAIGLRKGIPHVCIPTTYSGSEMSPMAFDKKSTLKDSSKIMPTVVIYDEDLTKSLPKRISAPDSINSITQSSESCHRTKDDNTSWSYIHLPGV